MCYVMTNKDFRVMQIKQIVIDGFVMFIATIKTINILCRLRNITILV